MLIRLALNGIWNDLVSALKDTRVRRAGGRLRDLVLLHVDL